MARRPRDYAAEYARRKRLHPESVSAARGHGSRERESVERRLRGLMKRENVRVDENGKLVRHGYEGGRRPSLRGVITRDNQAQFDRFLRDQKAATKAYERGDLEAGHRLWRTRDPSLPEWLFWYHGVYGRAPRTPSHWDGSMGSVYAHPPFPHGIGVACLL